MMTTTRCSHACPSPGCDVFPFATQTELDAHMANGDHTTPEARDAQAPTVHAQFENRTQNFTPGAKPSTGTPAAATGNLASEKQVAFIVKLGPERLEGLANGEGLPEWESMASKLTKVKASALIESLLELPVLTPLPGSPVAATGPAPSEKQMAFLTRLVAEREANVDLATITTKAAASALIDALLKTPKPVHEDVPLGLHLFDGDVLKVQRSAAGRFYVKRLDGPRDWAFLGDEPLKNLSAETLLTLEAAKAYGIQTGVCCCCGAELTDPKSVEAGIGPVCARNF